MVPAWISSLSPDVLEAVLHHPPPAELGPAPRPAAREDVPEQVRDEQHAAAFHVAAQVVERDLPMEQLKLHGEEHKGTLTAALNYAAALVFLKRFEEAKSLLRKTIPIARRVLGDLSLIHI